MNGSDTGTMTSDKGVFGLRQATLARTRGRIQTVTITLNGLSDALIGPMEDQPDDSKAHPESTALVYALESEEERMLSDLNDLEIAMQRLDAINLV